MPGDKRYVQVITPNVMRAREVKDLYNSLKATNVNMEERLTILLNTKMTVGDKRKSLIGKEHSTRKHTEIMDEILELINREANLLNRSRPEKSLAGLRLRLANLFLQFIELPENNPDTSERQIIPTRLLRQDLEKAQLNAKNHSLKT